MTQPGAAAMVASSMRPMRPAAPTTPILVAMVPAFRRYDGSMLLDGHLAGRRPVAQDRGSGIEASFGVIYSRFHNLLIAGNA
jgi:hypothetical protein